MSSWEYERREAVELVERVLHEDGFGFVVLWRYEDHWVDLKVYEVATVDAETGETQFRRTPEHGGADEDVPMLEADVYADGFIKWDGCCEIDWGSSHWCGAYWWERQVKLMRYLHDRAFELMGRSGDDEWTPQSHPSPKA